MGTDAYVVLELMKPEPEGNNMPYHYPYPWARIELRRDYVLFDLIAGGRSDNPEDAAVPVKEFIHERHGTVAFLYASDLEVIANAYLKKTGKRAIELEAITVAMQKLNELNEGDENFTRFLIYFN